MRETMITRTVVGANVSVLSVNVAEQEMTKSVYYVKGKATDTENVLRALKRGHDTENEKIVAVTNVEPVNMLYGMTEEDFIKYATPLPEAQMKREAYAETKAAKAKAKAKTKAAKAKTKAE